MSISRLFARAVAAVGAVMVILRRAVDGSQQPAWGGDPIIPAGKAQGRLPTLKMPTARGWDPGQLPVAAPGLKVNAFAAGLKHPRWIYVLPNRDVLVSEAMNSSRAPRNFFDYAMVATMQRAGAWGKSPNLITLLRDTDGDGVAEIQIGRAHD